MAIHKSLRRPRGMVLAALDAHVRGVLQLLNLLAVHNDAGLRHAAAPATESSQPISDRQTDET